MFNLFLCERCRRLALENPQSNAPPQPQTYSCTPHQMVNSIPFNPSVCLMFSCYSLHPLSPPPPPVVVVSQNSAPCHAAPAFKCATSSASIRSVRRATVALRRRNRPPHNPVQRAFLVRRQPPRWPPVPRRRSPPVSPIRTTSTSSSHLCRSDRCHSDQRQRQRQRLAGQRNNATTTATTTTTTAR